MLLEDIYGLVILVVMKKEQVYRPASDNLELYIV